MTTIRRPGAASAAVLIGLTASLLVAHTIAPDWSRRAGLDVWNLAKLEADRRSAAEARDDISAHAERSARRREAANQIASQLVAGTTTLSAATDQIDQIFGGDESVATTLEMTYYTVPTQRLRLARHTIDRAKRVFEDDPARFAAVSARLEAEYREMAAAHDSPAAP
jgi:hypothetical protein